VCDWSAFSNPGPNPQLLTGALVGGPDQSDFYEDRRDDYVKNEVTTDYNAGFQSAVAGLLHKQLKP
jgi:endoglucanase